MLNLFFHFGIFIATASERHRSDAIRRREARRTSDPNSRGRLAVD